MKKYSFETLQTGDSIKLGPYNVTRQEVLDFATEFDPAPFHLDDEAAAKSMLGKLSASGWHICAMTMRMLCDAILLDSTSLGSPGVEECKWLHPTFPGDVLSGKTTIVSKRLSKTNPKVGILQLEHLIQNQNGISVLEMKNAGMFGTQS